ncbi:hypothetical protein [Neoroseomonas oryzicola]|uniref:Uncharacterized protein n=1 Tax=Neoroseomonas oryzicola TaxID=535904 RepID=A0A9X9WE66_9PROT|nr:hypothetical protein [Neoroseomonas oryzicola]MBR0658626.1 hypothetical protein [Neoroseomonas oryzicola]NKE16657.1 hypothetical protein [Neoroseomonas oryzicola]
MAALVASSAVEAVVRATLAARGYRVSEPRRNGETGVDIEAVLQGERIFIEAIAFKSSPPARAKDFYEAFFRAASRADDAGARLVIALPSRFGRGLRQRAAAIGRAWPRIGAAFPELEIWLVDTEASAVREFRWNDWCEPDFQP